MIDENLIFGIFGDLTTIKQVQFELSSRNWEKETSRMFQQATIVLHQSLN